MGYKNETKSKRVVNIIIAITLVFSLIYGVANITYALIPQDGNQVVITIDKDGSYSSNKNLFGEEQWYPGKEIRGTITIHNNYKNMKITNLGLGVTINEFSSEYDYNAVYKSFLDNMFFSLKKGTFLVFSDDIIGEKSFYELLQTADDIHNGYSLDSSDHFNINKGSSISLDYTVYMDVSASNELENISADVDLLLNVGGETSTSPNPPNNPPDPQQQPEQPEQPDEPQQPETQVPPNDLNSPQDHSEEPSKEEVKDEATDIQDHWAHDCIIALIEHGIVKGYPDGTIRPENKITRAEVAALVARSLEIKEDLSKEPEYIDEVPTWVKGYVTALTDHDIYTGYPDDTFRAENNISREEVVAVLIRGFDKKLTEPLELVFKDKKQIGFWAVGYVKAGVQNKVLTGYPDNTFRPQNDITRAEVFTILCKLLGLHETHMYKIN